MIGAATILVRRLIRYLSARSEPSTSSIKQQPEANQTSYQNRCSANHFPAHPLLDASCNLAQSLRYERHDRTYDCFGSSLRIFYALLPECFAASWNNSFHQRVTISYSGCPDCGDSDIVHAVHLLQRISNDRKQ